MPLVNNQQGGFQGYSVVTRNLEGDIGPPAQIFNLTQTATSITEGQPVTFVVNTENVVAATNLYWKLAANSTASAADFSGAVSGVVSISSKSASVTLTSVVDTSNEGDQVFTVEFYKDAAYTNLAVAAAPVTIVDILFGEQVFSANAAEQTWTVPPGVTSISVIAVGGGGGGAQEGESTSGSTTRYAGAGAGGGAALVYKNNLPVTPGQVFKLVAGPGGAGAATYSQRAGNGTASYFAYANNTVIMTAGGGQGGFGNPLSTVMNYNAAGGPGGLWSGGTAGGRGGDGGWSNMSLGPQIKGGGGGGAGGYSRDEPGEDPSGGVGFWQTSWDLIRRGTGTAEPSYGGGGGGGGSYSNGGGVGIYGKAGGGGAGTTNASGVGTAGTPGSLLFGEAYGGGAGTNQGAGGNGVVRIMWPGEYRQFPSTNTYPTDQTYGLSASTTNLVEGYTITFTVNTSNVVSGTNVYWKMAANSTATAADFTSNTTGTLTISGGTASFSLTAKNDPEEGNETFTVELYKNFDYSDLLAVSPTITITSPAYGEVILSANSAEQTWNVPSGVASITVIAVGGGGGGAAWAVIDNLWAAGGPGGGGALAYKNNIPVVPGQTFKYRSGPGGAGATTTGVNGSAGLSSYFAYANNTVIMTAGGGGGGQGKPLSNSTSLGIFNAVFQASGGAGGTRSGGDGGGNGGAGGLIDMKYGQGITGYPGQRRGGGAGGAGGYAGDGGAGQIAEQISQFGSAGSGGAGGGGGGSLSSTTGKGGGVGIYGQGTSGSGGNGGFESQKNGGDGSVGYSTASLNTAYGDGAGASLSGSGASNGGNGVIRIIWPGNYRTFPNTNTNASAESYSVTSADYVVEGTSITFTVSTANVTANTVLYWNLTSNSTTSAADFTGSANGTVTINSSGYGTFSLTPSADGVNDPNETFSVELYRDRFGAYRELVAVSSPVTVLDQQPTTFPTGGTDRQLFTTTGLNTWTVPPTWTSTGYIIVAVRGAGGSGASTYGDGPGGPGGGGGALVLGKIAATPGQTLYINVGQAVYNANGTSSWINTTAATPPTSILQGYLAPGGGGGGHTHGGATLAGTWVGSSVYQGRNGGLNSSGSGGGGGAAATAAYNIFNIGYGGNASGFGSGVGGAGGGVRSNGGSTGGNSYYNENGGAAGESTNKSGAGGGRGENGNDLAQPRSGGTGGPYIGTGDPNAEYAGGGGGGGARKSSGGGSGGSGGGGGKYGGGGGGAGALQGSGSGGGVGSPGLGGDGMVLLVYYSA